jgi:hypothetical protein
MNPYKVYETIIDIHKHAEEAKHSILPGSQCAPNTFFETVLLAINSITDFAYQYIFFIAYIIMLVYGIYEFQHLSYRVKNGMLGMSLTLVIMLVGFCFNSYIISNRKMMPIIPTNNIIEPPLVDKLKNIYVNTPIQPKIGWFSNFWNYLTGKIV